MSTPPAAWMRLLEKGAPPRSTSSRNPEISESQVRFPSEPKLSESQARFLSDPEFHEPPKSNSKGAESHQPSKPGRDPRGSASVVPLLSHICVDCNVPLLDDNGIFYCDKCGREESDVVHDGDAHQNTFMSNDHNTGRNSFMSFKVVGYGARRYQRGMLCICANSEVYRSNLERRQLYDIVYKYEGNTIPKQVVEATLAMLAAIKKAGHIFRGNTKRGIWGACMASVCAQHRISKTPHEIADILNVDDRFLALAERKLQELAADGVVAAPSKLRPLQDYNNQVFASLAIPSQYKAFVDDIIARTDKKRVFGAIDMRTSTQCAGAIYILTRRVKELRHITKEEIARETHVVKGTFLKYAALIYSHYKIFKKVFKRHAIRMPVWMKGAPPLSNP